MRGATARGHSTAASSVLPVARPRPGESCSAAVAGDRVPQRDPNSSLLPARSAAALRSSHRTPFVKLFVSIIVWCWSHCSPLAHHCITVSPRNRQLSTTRIVEHLFSPLHVEKSIRGSRCAVNVNCAKITKSETSVTMETLKARLISRINYDKKLFMAVFKQ